MTEWRLFPQGEIPYVSTFAFHEDRPRAAHLEDATHLPRLERAAEFVKIAAARLASIPATVSDLGCGDGGLLQLLRGHLLIDAWGYDWHPPASAGWKERGVTAYSMDVFGVARAAVTFGEISVATEVLEHLADPHDAVSWIAGGSRYLVASSPRTEDDQSHDPCHAWAWDMEGYRALLEGGGWEVVRHEGVGMFQVVLAESRRARP